MPRNIRAIRSGVGVFSARALSFACTAPWGLATDPFAESAGARFIGIRYPLRSALVPQCHDERAGLGQPARLVFRVKGRRRRRSPSRWHHAFSRAGSLLYGSWRGRWLGSSTRPGCFAGTRERGVHDEDARYGGRALNSGAGAPPPPSPQTRQQSPRDPSAPVISALGRKRARMRGSLHAPLHACRPIRASPRAQRRSS